MPIFDTSMKELMTTLMGHAETLFNHAKTIGADVAGTDGVDKIIDPVDPLYVDLRAGDDLLQSSAHLGLVDMGAGHDFVSAASAGLVRLGSGDDTFSASGEASLVLGESGNDTINLMSGGLAHGGSGNDTVLAQGSFAISGGSGQDALSVFVANAAAPLPAEPNVATGGSGYDTLKIILTSGDASLATRPVADDGTLAPGLYADAARAIAEGAGLLHDLGLRVLSIEEIVFVIDGITHAI